MYLKKKETTENEEQKSKVGLGNHFYYEAMVFLMNKHTRIIQH